METKATNQKMEHIRRKLGFDHCEVAEAHVLAGAIALLWSLEINMKFYGILTAPSTVK